MPVADAQGKVSYKRTITVSQDVVEHIKDLHIVQHGIDRNDNDKYDFEGAGKSELDPKLPQEATAPTNCGVVKGAAVGSIPVGGVETGSGPRGAGRSVGGDRGRRGSPSARSPAHWPSRGGGRPPPWPCGPGAPREPLGPGALWTGVRRASAAVVAAVSAALAASPPAPGQERCRRPRPPPRARARPRARRGGRPDAGDGSGQGRLPPGPKSVPQRVSIPSLGVSSTLETLGQNEDGAMETPK